MFGVIVFIITYFEDSAGLPYAIATLIPFILPSLALGTFLVLTEKDRSKPWVIQQREKYMKYSFECFAIRHRKSGLVCFPVHFGSRR